MRKTLLYASIAAPLFMTFVSLSSLIDGVVQWGAFIQDFTDTYTRFIRDPLHWLASLVWPQTWPIIPKALIDMFVLWTSFYGISRAYLALESEYVRTADGEGLDASSIVVTDWRQKLILWALGPISVWYFSRKFVAKMQLIVDLEHSWFGGPSERPEFIQDAQRISADMNKGYLTLAIYSFLGFVIILFLNWQMIQQCQNPPPSLKATGICKCDCSPLCIASTSPTENAANGFAVDAPAHQVEHVALDGAFSAQRHVSTS